MSFIGFIIDLLIDQIPCILNLTRAPQTGGANPFQFISKLTRSSRSLLAPKSDHDLNDDNLSEMADGEIWFDGVDKRLIEAHSKKIELVKGDDSSLLTRTPLISYKGICKKRKTAALANEQQQNGDHQQQNGHKSSDNIVINIAPLNGNNTKSTTTTNISKVTPLSGSMSKEELAKYMLKPCTGLTEEIALDCEMVECYGHKSVLARVSVVNLFGHPVLDSYVTPPDKVTDYRTRYSGIRRSDLENAPSFETVQRQVARMMKDRIVVGHAIHNDFSALQLSHPADKTRDTSHYFGRNYFLGKTPSLKKLCHSILGVGIQKGEHDSVQDAQATMRLYVKVREKWNEGCLKRKQPQKQKAKKQKNKPKKKKVKAFFVETL